MADIRILLVDDEKDFILPLAERLETRGIDVTTAHEGQRALELIEKRKFNVVILDMVMPGMDGMETLRLIRKKHPNLQIVMLTGHAQLEQGVEAIKAGAADYLEKPIEFKKLLSKIDDARARTKKLRKKSADKDVDDILKRRGW